MVLRSEGWGFPKLEEQTSYMIKLDGLLYQEFFCFLISCMNSISSVLWQSVPHLTMHCKTNTFSCLFWTSYLLVWCCPNLQQETENIFLFSCSVWLVRLPPLSILTLYSAINSLSSLLFTICNSVLWRTIKSEASSTNFFLSSLLNIPFQCRKGDLFLIIYLWRMLKEIQNRKRKCLFMWMF